MGRRNKNKQESCGAVLYYVDEDLNVRVVLGKEKHSWGPFKGRREKDETRKQCARREIFEETGLIEEIIFNGTEKTRVRTKETVYLMRKAMGLAGVRNRMRRKIEKRQKKLAKAAAE